MSLAAGSARKGATRVADVPPDVLALLEAGAVPTVNLTEFLAVRPGRLLWAVASQLDLSQNGPVPDDLQLTALKPMQRHRAISAWLHGQLATHARRDALAHQLASHASDVVRQWAVLWLEHVPGMALSERLEAVGRFAADPHFGVREIAWMAVRGAVAADVPQALVLLQPWTGAEDPLLRRFASEVTRPRGVWCAHIEVLKRQPEMALALLEPLRADPSPYVRDSVANWLNDASKSQPDWVRAVCQRWVQESPGVETRSLVKRALRTVGA